MSALTRSALPDLNALLLPDLFEALFPGDALPPQLRSILDEDLDDAGDVTSRSIIEPHRTASAAMHARQPGVIAGLALMPQLVRLAEEELTWSPAMQDGERIDPDMLIGHLTGSLRDILRLERTALNLIGRLSGIATLTRQYVDAIAETDADICDTRKTTPGMRRLEKYAVRCGGGTLHRLGLYDAVLYKDNHLAHLSIDELVPRLTEAIRNVRAEHDLRFVEVEVDTLEQLEVTLAIESDLIDIVLLDNMSPAELRQAVAMRDERQSAIKLEASGGVNLDTVSQIAEAGVDRIAVGALTHSAPALDVGLDSERGSA